MRSVNNQQGSSHCHYSQHCPCEWVQYQHQSEHCQRPLHLIISNISYNRNISLNIQKYVCLLTLSRISQLSTHNSGIRTPPRVITHGTPQIVNTDLHSAFICNVTSSKPQLTICTWSCEKKEIYCVFSVTRRDYSQNIPSQPTPASAV